MKKNNLPIAQRTLKIAEAVKALTYTIGFLGFLSVLKYIDLPYLLAFSTLFLLSVYFEYKKRFFIPRRVLNIMALSVIVLAFFREAADPVEAAVEALLILLTIKLLGEKRFRDYMQIYLIAVFLLTGSALLSIDIDFLFYLIFLIFMVSITLVLLTYYSQDSSMTLKTPAFLKILSRSSTISLIAIPATLFMFIILPRSSYPLLTFLNRGTHASAGFTDNVTLGKVSDIQEDSSVILRAHMEPIGENSLYWRGIVLDYFDGAVWNSSHNERTDKNIRLRGRQVLQTIYLEPYGNKYLFALDKPFSLYLGNVQKGDELTYSLKENISRRTRYESLSVLSDVMFEENIDRDVYLQMSERGLEKTRELARSLSSGKTHEETVEAILRFLRDGDYRYSLENLPITGNPMEDFLFKYKYGNCEYFASAMAVMLRMSGIPSRLVGGYKGGYYNTGGYYLVPQKNAHVWVEAYLENKGWLRVDPTPGGIENFVSLTKKDFFFRMRLFLDTINYYWNAVIINYDFNKQISLLSRLSSVRKPKIHISLKKDSIIRYLIVPLFIGALIFLMYHLRFNKKAAEERILNFFLKKLVKYGYRKAPSEGLEEFVSKIREGELKGQALAFVREFEGYFYRDKKLTKEALRRLKQVINWK